MADAGVNRGVARRTLALLARHGACAAVLAPLAAWYLWLNWYDGLGSLMGDGLIYVSTARHYAPYWPAHPLDAVWAAYTQFPPVFALVLAAAGGAADLRLAHAATTVCLIAAFAVSYGWLLTLGVSRLRAAAMTAVLALAPGVFLQSFHLYPEGLYVCLSLGALIALVRGESTSRAGWFWAAALLVAIAIVTRTVGVTLLPALVVALVRHRPARWPGMIALALAPALAWNLTHDPPFSYTDALRDVYLDSSPEAIWQTVRASIESAASGLLHNLSQNPQFAWFAVALGAVAASVAVRRFFQWRPDAWYLSAYLATLAIWPYPVEGPRLTWVVLPILLGYLLWVGEQLSRRADGFGRARPAIAWLPVAAVALMVLPEFALLAARAVHPEALARPAYRHFPQWYTPALDRARVMTELHLGVADAFRKFAPRIPEDQCFFSSLQDLAAFYTRREARTPPPASVDAATFDEELRRAGCRYFVFAIASAQDDEQVLYPLDRVRDRIEILDVQRMNVPGEPPVAVLGVLRSESPR